MTEFRLKSLLGYSILMMDFTVCVVVLAYYVIGEFSEDEMTTLLGIDFPSFSIISRHLRYDVFSYTRVILDKKTQAVPTSFVFPSFSARGRSRW
jgi:hypothetical protein